MIFPSGQQIGSVVNMFKMFLADTFCVGELFLLHVASFDERCKLVSRGFVL